MTPDLRIQQALVLGDGRGVRVVAQTDDFDAPVIDRIAQRLRQRSRQFEPAEAGTQYQDSHRADHTFRRRRTGLRHRLPLG